MTDQQLTGGLVEHEGADQPTADPMALPGIDAGAAKHVAFMWRWLLLAGAAGAWSGFLIGGVLGRLAMFILRTTSADSVRGIDSDDGFTIGQFSAATIFLLAVTTVLGMFVGLVAVLARSQLRGRVGFVLIVLAGGSVGAAAIIKPEGVDFNLLAPLSLACAMFTAIPLAATALALVFAHRWRVWWWRDRRRTAIALLPMLIALPLFIVSGPTATVSLLLGVGALRVRFLRNALTGRVGYVVTAAVVVVVIGVASAELIRDVAEIL